MDTVVRNMQRAWAIHEQTGSTRNDVSFSKDTQGKLFYIKRHCFYGYDNIDTPDWLINSLVTIYLVLSFNSTTPREAHPSFSCPHPLSGVKFSLGMLLAYSAAKKKGIPGVAQSLLGSVAVPTSPNAVEFFVLPIVATREKICLEASVQIVPNLAAQPLNNYVKTLPSRVAVSHYLSQRLGQSQLHYFLRPEDI